MTDACCGGEESTEPGPGTLRDIGELRAAAVAGAALALGVSVGWAGASRLSSALLLVALAVGGSTFMPGAARGLLRRRLSVATLMAVAAVGAVLLGDLVEAATLAFLFSISEALESFALAHTRRGLRALLDLAPAEATVLVGDRLHVVAIGEIVPGDVLVVRPGERIATDGVIRAGRSALDLSAITGESLPVERGPGDEVYAAAINGSAALEVVVSAAAEDNSLARIVAIVEQAQEHKGASQRLAERIARPLVPGVLVVATLVAALGALAGDPALWIGRALVVLVAAAPCAFAISVPVTVVAAIGAATRSGVLIKGGAALEALGRVRVVAIDKTGTLTANRPRVVEVACAPKSTPGEVLALAAGLEARSEHPLARAVLAAAGAPAPADDVESIAGSGLVGTIAGEVVRVGRPGFVAAGALSWEVERIEAEGASVVVVERAGAVVGAIAVRDELRPEAAEVIGALHAAGMATAMLTGDNRVTAEALGRASGVGVVHAELLPADKATAVQRLGALGVTAMVGDGINDAPALATASVGIAMGAMGADVAIEAADVALMGDDLRRLPEVFAHARRASRIMAQNLALSGSILLVLVPLAAAGALGLAAVVAIHEVAEVLVIANGLRAGRRRCFADDGSGAEVRPSPSPSPSPSPAPTRLAVVGPAPCSSGCCATEDAETEWITRGGEGTFQPRPPGSTVPRDWSTTASVTSAVQGDDAWIKDLEASPIRSHDGRAVPPCGHHDRGVDHIAGARLAADLPSGSRSSFRQGFDSHSSGGKEPGQPSFP